MNIPERTNKSIMSLTRMIQKIKSIHNIHERTIIEIGSWTGLSMIEFAKEFKHVTCVDPWAPTEGINTKYDMREVEKIFDRRAEKFNNVEKLKMTSEEAAAYLDFKVDSLQEKKTIFGYCYIDGCHTYDAVKKDLKLWKDRIKYAICGHDYCNQFPGVKKAVDEVVGKPDHVFTDSSWIKWKRK